MAVKRIVKFVLQLAVAVAILVGGYFLVKTIFFKTSASNVLVEASISKNLVQEVKESREGIKANSEAPMTAKVNACDNINDVLIRYYEYYLSNSMFVNADDKDMRNVILNKMNELAEKVEVTKRYTKLFATSNNEVLKDRVKLAAKAYAQQTKTFFELVEALKDYVYKVNYNGVENSGIVYESQLEMIKDYSKTAFYEGVYGKLDNSSTSEILTVEEVTSFKYTLQKFNENYANNGMANSFSSYETLFAKFYMGLSKTELNDFYKLNKFDKNSYVANIVDNLKRTGFEKLYDYLQNDFFKEV